MLKKLKRRRWPVALALLIARVGAAHGEEGLAESFWDHNGSSVYLVARGVQRQFYYDTPRTEISAQGVRRGTLLFDGRQQGDGFHGTAYVFSSTCGPASYPVKGAVSADERRVWLRGRAPRRDGKCRTTGYRDDELVFEHVAKRMPAETTGNVAAIRQARPAARPSFSCTTASRSDDVAICSDADLASLELTATIAFDFAQGFDAARARAGARAFLKERRACRDDKACIRSVLARSLDLFRAIAEARLGQ